MAQLAQHPNIQGIKDSTGDIAQLTEIIRMVPREFAVLVGSDTVFYPALCVGATGGVLATPNVIPDLLVELFNLFLEGKHLEALNLQRRINPLASLVLKDYGVGGIKLAMDMMGFQGGGVRSPPDHPPRGQGPLQRRAGQAEARSPSPARRNATFQGAQGRVGTSRCARPSTQQGPAVWLGPDFFRCQAVHGPGGLVPSLGRGLE